MLDHFCRYQKCEYLKKYQLLKIVTLKALALLQFYQYKTIKSLVNYRIYAIKAILVGCDFSFECFMSFQFSFHVGQISVGFICRNLKFFLNPGFKLKKGIQPFMSHFSDFLLTGQNNIALAEQHFVIDLLAGIFARSRLTACFGGRRQARENASVQISIESTLARVRGSQVFGSITMRCFEGNIVCSLVYSRIISFPGHLPLEYLA